MVLYSCTGCCWDEHGFTVFIYRFLPSFQIVPGFVYRVSNIMKLYVGVPCWVPFWPDFTGFLPSFHSVPSFVRTLGSVGRRRRFRFFFVFLSIRLISNDAMLNDSVAVVSFVFLFLVSFLFCFWGSVSVFGDTTWFYRVFFFASAC